MAKVCCLSTLFVYFILLILFFISLTRNRFGGFNANLSREFCDLIAQDLGDLEATIISTMLKGNIMCKSLK